MKRKWSDILIIAICLLVVGGFLIKSVIGTGRGIVRAEAALPNPTQTVVATPTPTPMKLDASYTGPAVIVGEKFDKTYLLVTITYSNGLQENVTDFTVSTEIVQSTGMNTIVVIYGELTAKAYVYGRKLTGISVTPIKTDYGVGNMPDSKDLTVTGTYSDGTVEVIKGEYEIFPEKLEKSGKNEVTVRYQNMEAKCYVYAKNWTKVEALSVTYDKNNMVTNMKIDRNDITVIAVYSDLSSERITTYQLEKEIYYDTGKQPLTVVYGGVKKTIQIEVTERYIVGLEAEYKGGSVVVGKKFRDSDLHVYLKYVDGELVETNDYTIHSRKIRYVGNNPITIYYGDKFSVLVNIEGVEESRPDFDYVSELTADNGTDTVIIRTALPKYLNTDCMVSETVKKSLMKKAFRKLNVKKGKYIAFTYEFTNQDDELELPLTARITIPERYDMDHTFLYYTPNRKTVLGRVNKTVISDTVFECTLFKTGTYMLVYSEELEDEDEE
ncbi:MAG: bacterial Ig-like domain-containing protein [Lachnospiraceae bacterium]|nr:bacterial Ig-like domain-containing protein [Lachnospiraceae bacterium]